MTSPDRITILINPYYLVRNLWKHRQLIVELTRREISQQYQGSFFGFMWSILAPLSTLLIYTFVFSVVFKARWPGQVETSLGAYAVILFAGITPFNVFSMVASRAPGLILGVPSYVKKVVFPIEMMPVVVLGSALFTSLINIVLIILANYLFLHKYSAAIIFLPMAYLPLIFLCLGIGWFLASLGVYIRDIGQGVAIVLQMLFFLSPIFYPIEAVPDTLQKIIMVNPLTLIVTFFRQILIWNMPLPWVSWALVTIAAFVFALLGYVWFMKTKKGFADVL